MNSIINHDAESIYNDFLENLENEIGEPLYPGDERRIFAEAIISVLVAMLSTADDKVKQSRLQYAREDVLDEIGEMFGISRMDGTKATTIVEFSTNTAVSVDVTIPKGALVTCDYEHYFATKEDVVLVAGETSVSAVVEATNTGAEYNDIAVGEINVLTTAIAYIDSVKNVEITTGGADVEGDDEYRDRIQLSMDRFASGTENYYKYIAMTANNTLQDIFITNDYEDVRIDGITDDFLFSTENMEIFQSVEGYKSVNFSVISENGQELQWFTSVIGNNVAKVTKEDRYGNEYSLILKKKVPGTVLIYAVCKDGAIPSTTILEQIEKACNDNSVRCFNDKIIVKAAVPYEYKINAWCYINPSDDIETVKANIANAVEEYKKWQSSKIGKNINKDKLQMFLMQAGAYKVSINFPSHKVLQDYNIATCTETEIGYVVQEEN